MGSLSRQNSRLMFAVAAAVLTVGPGGLGVQMRETARERVGFNEKGVAVRSSSASNGGRRRTVAQDKRRALKARNRRRHKQHA
jgi:hypothetical protein